MKNVRVIGMGCKTCKALYEMVKKVVSEENLPVEVEYSTDVSELMELGVMSSPVVTVDGQPLRLNSTDKKSVREALLAAAALEISLRKDIRPLKMETTFLRIDGETCQRCGITSAVVTETVARLSDMGILVDLVEKTATRENLSESNTISINGYPLEELLGAERVATECVSCGDLCGGDVDCSAISLDGDVQTSPTVDQLVAATLVAMNLPLKKTGCSYGGSCCG